MNFIDFHLHLSGKAFFSAEKPEERFDIDKELEAMIWFQIDELLGDRIDSQSNLKQLNNGQAKIVLAALYAFELPLATVLKPVKKGDIKGVFDRSFYDKLVAGNFKPYPGLIEDEIKYLKIQEEKFGNKVHLAKTSSDMDLTKLNVILNIEGAHALLDDPYRTSSNVIEGEVEQRALTNLLHLKTRKDIRIFSMNLCHFAKNPCCTHAYGMMKEDRKFFDFEPAIPVGQLRGIRSFGKKVVDLALSNTRDNGELHNRIYIDMKHMSLYSRLDYYAIQAQDKNKEVPLFITHTAPNGMSILERFSQKHNNNPRTYVENATGICQYKFNSSSMNLYDEEIRWIVMKQGLICLSLDQRVLGAAVSFQSVDRRKYVYDPMTPEEYDGLMGHPMFSELWKNDQDGTKSYRKGLMERTNRKHMHADYLANAILRCVWAGGEDTWNRLAIGSDFDGLIDALDCCKTSEQLPELAELLVSRILYLLQYDKDFSYYIRDEKDVRDKVEQIFWNNGIAFLQKHF